MDTMERRHFFGTRRTREPLKQALQHSSVETARIADFQAGLLAVRIAHEEAAAMSPTEKFEARSRSSAERRKFTPAV
jgi:hypothetical protein